MKNPEIMISLSAEKFIEFIRAEQEYEQIVRHLRSKGYEVHDDGKTVKIEGLQPRQEDK